ncbi:MAG: Lysophospholipase L1 [Verrucomicrobia bacterium]|jgi:lysophospholipase L1-like esterase|nr:MAG: Lysophospholipase L1 [Verrucomicrobiota bacterium]
MQVPFSQSTPHSRRRVLKSGAVAVLSAAPSLLATAGLPPALAPGSVILFQGDSITDAGRDKLQSPPNLATALGRGYAMLAAAQLLEEHPRLQLKIFNRGISGNKVPDLEARWQADCLDLKPAVVSVLIGVNDLWHKLNGKYDGTPEAYRDGFAALLQSTRAALPEVTLVVGEPFVLRCGAVNDSWFPEFETRRALAREVAKEAKALWVPFQEKFDEAVAAGTEPGYWAADGVHPSPAGHALMARAWRSVVGV